jgi:hypothetical protein
MMTLSKGSSNIVSVLDHRALKQSLLERDAVISELEDINRFTYASFPEGSHGKFLINAKDINLINDATYDVRLTITGQLDTFIHSGLRVSNVEYFTVPLTGWSISSTPPEGQLAIVTVHDRYHDWDDLLVKDHNRISTQAPTDWVNDFEPEYDDLEDWDSIWTTIGTDHSIKSENITFSLTGIPEYKPKNVLSAGTSVKNLLDEFCKAHFVTGYFDKSGNPNVTVTNAVTGSDMTPTNPVVFSSYGTSTIPKKLAILFSNQSRKFARLRTNILETIYSDYASDWQEKIGDITSNDDTTLANNNDPEQDSTLEFGHYFAFHDHLGETTTCSGTATGTGLTPEEEACNILDGLSTNLANKFHRSCVIGYKDVVDLDPSNTIEKIIYTLEDPGMLTFISTSSPRGCSVPPMLSHVARGFEYVPPFLHGTVPVPNSEYITEFGPDYAGGFVPNQEAQLTIDGTRITIYNECTQQMFTGETVGVHYDALAKRYAFLDRCERFFQYQLLSNWYGGIALATRMSMDGVSSGKIVVVRDPLGIFSYLHSGDCGYMVYTVEDKFYAIQAPCENKASKPSGLGACCLDGVCYDEVDPTDCSSAGGTHQGAGTDCTTVSCPGG